MDSADAFLSLSTPARDALSESLTSRFRTQGQNRCACGVLRPGSQATHLLYAGTITENAAVKWIDPRGKTAAA